jgi:hypothetical protein
MHALHLPDVGEGVFCMDAYVGSEFDGGGANEIDGGRCTGWPTSTSAVNACFVRSSFAINSHGEEMGHHQLRNSESIGNLLLELATQQADGHGVIVGVK